MTMMTKEMKNFVAGMRIYNYTSRALCNSKLEKALDRWAIGMCVADTTEVVLGTKDFILAIPDYALTIAAACSVARKKLGSNGVDIVVKAVEDYQKENLTDEKIIERADNPGWFSLRRSMSGRGF